VREEDDELLRAAEELGIDLSPAAVRAAAEQPTAQDVEAGALLADDGGDLLVAADEDLDETEAGEEDDELEVADFVEAEVEVED
jgi:hypothetical protein